MLDYHLLNIAILHPSNENSLEPFVPFDLRCDPSRYLPGPNYVHFEIHKVSAVKQVTEIMRQPFDVIVNQCDGAWMEDRPGIEVVQALERFNAAFTGASSDSYDPSREEMKVAAVFADVKIPAYFIARSSMECDKILKRLRFPMIVKHPHGYASVGITSRSLVNNADELLCQLQECIHQFGSALVEEFIEGREFTVLVTESREGEDRPWVLPPVEFCFPKGESFKHFDLKWKHAASMQTASLENKALDQLLKESSAAIFEGLNCSGFARCDWRMNAAGELFFLEINPCCGVFYPDGLFGSADFILAQEPFGHRLFFEHLLFCAKRRQERNFQRWEYLYDRTAGGGLFATHPIPKGEVAVKGEEKSSRLVSSGYIGEYWSGLKKQLFQKQLVRISENIFQLWNQDGKQWSLINHSCDPNLWLDGLNLIARRPIGVGEEMTVDYATLYSDGIKAFKCCCGTANCRGEIRSTDCHLSEVILRYGDHISDHVRFTQRSQQDTLPYIVREMSYGAALFASHHWKKGELISPLSWKNKYTAPTRMSVQRSENLHADIFPFELRYMNHSCNPNVVLDLECDEVKALRDILPGDELTFFYPSTEWEMAEPFSCQCKAERCLGEIGGSVKMPVETLSKYQLSPIVMRYLAASGKGALSQSARGL